MTRKTSSPQGLLSIAALLVAATTESGVLTTEERPMLQDGFRPNEGTTSNGSRGLSTASDNTTIGFTLEPATRLPVSNNTIRSSSKALDEVTPVRVDVTTYPIPSIHDPIRLQSWVVRDVDLARQGSEVPRNSTLTSQTHSPAEFALAVFQAERDLFVSSGRLELRSLMGGRTFLSQHQEDAIARMTELEHLDGMVYGDTVGLLAGSESPSGFSSLDREMKEQSPSDTFQFSQRPSAHAELTAQEGQSFLGHLASTRGSDTSVTSESPASPARHLASLNPHQTEPATFFPTRSVHVDLSATELGAVKVRVALSDQTVHAHIKTDQTQLGQLLFAHRDQLQSSMGAVGLDLGELRVSVGQHEQDPGFHGESSSRAQDDSSRRNETREKPVDPTASTSVTVTSRAEERLLSIVA